MTTTKDIAIYLACAPEDQAIRKKLEMHLSSLQHLYQITWWHKDLVIAGRARSREIESHLQNADIVLLLISPHFLQSEECFDVEMLPALKRREVDEVQVIPIIARPTPLWEEQPFGKLQVLPRSTEPITSWPNRDLAYQEIAEEIGNCIKTMQPELTIQSTMMSTRPPLPALPPLVQKRSKLVKHIYKHLAQDISALMLTGIGGVGKTTLSKLVYFYAKKQFEAGKGLFQAEPIWIEIQPSFTIDDLVVRIFRALGKSSSNLGRLLPQEQAELLIKALDEDKTRLVIVDQFEHFLDTSFRQTSPESSGTSIWLELLNNSHLHGSRVLLTSRMRPSIASYPHGRIEVFPVPDLDLAEGVAFLKSSLHVSGIESPEPDLFMAVEHCKKHPLSLVFLASLLQDDRSLSLSVILNDPRYSLELDTKVADKLLNVIFRDRIDQAQRQLLCAFAIFREPATLEAAASLMGLSIETSTSFKLLLANLNALRHRYLLQDTGSLCYQLHPLIAGYVHNHFAGQNEQENHLAQLEAHARAAEYYQQRAKNSCPPRKQRTNLLDFHDLIEAAWHWCISEHQEDAYQLICREGLFVDIQRCGGNTILFELYLMLLPGRWKLEPSQLAHIYNEFGQILRALGQRREAYNYLMKALSLFEEVQDLTGQVKTLNNLGVACKDLGRLEEAFTCYQQASHVCDTMSPPDIQGQATALNNMGVLSLDFGQREQALGYFEQALTVQQMLEDHGETATTLMNIGKIYDLLKRNDEALLKYNQALRIFEKIGDRGMLATLYNHLGQFIRTRSGREKLERKREAWEYHVKALHIFQEIGDRWEEATTYQHLGRLSFVQEIGRYPSTIEYFKVSLAFYLHAGNIFKALQFPEKETIPELEINELRMRFGEEQLAPLIAAIEPQAREIVEQTLQKGYILS